MVVCHLLTHHAYENAFIFIVDDIFLYREIEEREERERMEKERQALLEERRLEEEAKGKKGKKGARRDESSKRSVSGMDIGYYVQLFNFMAYIL